MPLEKPKYKTHTFLKLIMCLIMEICIYITTSYYEVGPITGPESPEGEYRYSSTHS
jgi:hypothetical protein